MFKTPEEIRKEKGINQRTFCELIDIPYRTYHERLSGNHPKWTIDELVKLSNANNGEVRIGNYDIKIKEN